MTSALCGWFEGLSAKPKTTESTDHSGAFDKQHLKRSWSNNEHGQVEKEGFKIRQREITEPVNQTDTNKHLGILQSRQTEHTNINKELTTALISRMKEILKAHLNNENLTMAICTYVIPSLTYSWIIIQWNL
jgi:hypothetical protein